MDGIYTGMQKPSEDVYSTVNQTQGKRAGAQQGDPTPPVSAAGKASSYRQPALVLLILCCLLLAAIISLAVYHFKTKEDLEKNTSLSTNYSSLLNQLQDLRSDYSNLNKNHSELQSNYSKLSGSHANLQSNYSWLNETHSELQSNYSRLQKENSALKKNNTELSVKSSILDKYCPLKEGSSKERVCKACPEKWVESNGTCYYFSPDKMDWHSSRASCVSMGADLVIIESDAEQKFLLENDKSKPLLGNAEKNSYWIGLTDAATEGTWLWVDGTPLNDKAKYWHGNEPDDWKRGGDSSGEDCARLAYSTSPANSLKAWFDASCTRQQHRRICETTALINI
ncbi:asialoglycoprotein receptor 1-like [Acipenser ruthenus]|uniref:asialoglycoprotein receptor 1-like n=1 Tax=Acipenser ruthenus TaxID=7906 RepID=UPI002741C969|nr:asialoglycoprotein receptor 1-like [Acipenser ruthenus]